MRTTIKAVLLALVVLTPLAAEAQFSVTYQGRLVDGGTPVDGDHEMYFIIYDAATGGTQLDFVNLPNVAVVDGYFTADLDFASPALFVSADRWLEIRVRPLGGVQTILEPRQKIKPVPRSLQSDYDIHSVNVSAPLQVSSPPGFPGNISLSLEGAFLQRIDTLETLVTDQASVIAALQNQIADLQTAIDALTADVADVQGRVATV